LGNLINKRGEIVNASFRDSARTGGIDNATGLPILHYDPNRPSRSQFLDADEHHNYGANFGTYFGEDEYTHEARKEWMRLKMTGQLNRSYHFKNEHGDEINANGQIVNFCRGDSCYQDFSMKTRCRVTKLEIVRFDPHRKPR